MVLVHADGHVRVGFDRRFNQAAKERFAGILTGAGGSLHDDGCADFAGGGHDGLNLFEIIDVEGRDAVAVFSCMIEQLTHGNKSHEDELR